MQFFEKTMFLGKFLKFVRLEFNFRFYIYVHFCKFFKGKIKIFYELLGSNNSEDSIFLKKFYSKLMLLDSF